jgi:hypothetical protein
MSCVNAPSIRRSRLRSPFLAISTMCFANAVLPPIGWGSSCRCEFMHDQRDEHHPRKHRKAEQKKAGEGVGAVGRPISDMRRTGFRSHFYAVSASCQRLVANSVRVLNLKT